MEENVDFVVCPICGAKKRNLTKHIIMLHKLTKEEFLNMYPGTLMQCADTSTKISNYLKSQWENPEYAAYHTYVATKEYGNPGGASNKGKPKSEITRQRIKAYANSAEGKATRSKTMKRYIDSIRDTEAFKTRLRNNGKTQMRKNLEDPNYGHKRYKYNNISYRSTWEVEVAKVLDALNIKYYYEYARFTWVDSDGIERTYMPDFYLPDINTYLEVKPICFITEITDAKLKSVIDSGYKAMYLSTNNAEEITKILSNLCQTKTP